MMLVPRRPVDQWYTIESPEVKPHSNGKVILIKKFYDHSMGIGLKWSLFLINGAGKTGYPRVK